VPEAPTWNAAVCPTRMDLLLGCVVMAGATSVVVPTLSVAALLVTLPCELLTATVNCVPLSDVVVAGVV